MNIKLEDFDLSQGVLNEAMLEAVDFLTIRSIQWQNHYAREAWRAGMDGRTDRKSLRVRRDPAMENAPGTTGGQGCGEQRHEINFTFRPAGIDSCRILPSR